MALSSCGSAQQEQNKMVSGISTKEILPEAKEWRAHQ